MARTVTIGSVEFKVDLAHMHDAIGTVTTAADAIESDFTAIEGFLKGVEGIWSSPAAKSYADVYPQLVSRGQDLVDVLRDMIRRMQTTYDNYAAAEHANKDGFSHHGK